MRRRTKMSNKCLDANNYNNYSSLRDLANYLRLWFTFYCNAQVLLWLLFVPKAATIPLDTRVDVWHLSFMYDLKGAYLWFVASDLQQIRAQGSKALLSHKAFSDLLLDELHGIHRRRSYYRVARRRTVSTLSGSNSHGTSLHISIILVFLSTDFNVHRSTTVWISMTLKKKTNTANRRPWSLLDGEPIPQARPIVLSIPQDTELRSSPGGTQLTFRSDAELGTRYGPKTSQIDTDSCRFVISWGVSWKAVWRPSRPTRRPS